MGKKGSDSNRSLKSVGGMLELTRRIMCFLFNLRRECARLCLRLKVELKTPVKLMLFSESQPFEGLYSGHSTAGLSTPSSRVVLGVWSRVSLTESHQELQ